MLLIFTSKALCQLAFGQPFSPTPPPSQHMTNQFKNILSAVVYFEVISVLSTKLYLDYYRHWPYQFTLYLFRNVDGTHPLCLLECIIRLCSNSQQALEPVDYWVWSWGSSGIANSQRDAGHIAHTLILKTKHNTKRSASDVMTVIKARYKWKTRTSRKYILKNHNSSKHYLT